MNDVLARLRPVLVPGETPFGCNTVEVDGRRIGWVLGDPSLRLADVVRDVLGAEPLAPPPGAPPGEPRRSPWGRAPTAGGAVMRMAMEEARRRQHAIDASSGKYAGAFSGDYLAELRRDWPE